MRKVRPDINMKGLSLVRGVSIEKVREQLDPNGGFPGTILIDETGPGSFYFRQTPVSIGPSQQQSVINRLGQPDSRRRISGWGNRPIMTYFGYHRIDDDWAFDRSQLHGPITFKDGCLVERTFFYVRE